MCLSDSKVNSREIKESFKQMVEVRTNFTKEKDFSQFLICMLEYMEKILEDKVGIRVTREKSFFSCLPCCGDDYNYRNVRKEFQKSFEECNSREQLQYYRNFVHFMTGKPLAVPFAQPKLSMPNTESVMNPGGGQEEELVFDVQSKGNFGWSSGYTMKLIPERHILILVSPSQKETVLNLRNYILRSSKLKKENSYVLSGIVPVDPFKARFAVSDKEKNKMTIIRRIKEEANKAIQQNIRSWMEPVTHITSVHNSPLETRKVVTSLFEKQNQKQKSAKESKKQTKKDAPPEIKITSSINNPLKNKIIDKAKVGIIKKTFQYKQEAQSKQDKQSNYNLQSERNTLKMEENPGKALFVLKEKENRQQESPMKNLATLMSLNSPDSNGNPSQNAQEAFKKKPKSPLSYNSAKELEPVFTKRKPSLVRVSENYAQQPEDTRSDSGLILERKLTETSRPMDKDLEDKMDSGKSLMNGLDQEVIIEQEQFGNLSQISHDTDLSFQTIPEPQK